MAPDNDFEATMRISLRPRLIWVQNHASNTKQARTTTSVLSTPRIGSINDFSSSEFNVTLAVRTLVAELFEVKLKKTVFPSCEGGCKDTDFCGQDGTCHEYNCANVYDNGPKSVTGHDYRDTSAPKLECSTEPPTVDDSKFYLYNPDAFDAEITSTVESPWPSLIRYHCSQHEITVNNYTKVQPFKEEQCTYDFLDGRYATLNRFCSAQPSPYQNLPATTWILTRTLNNLADYLNKTAFNSECTKENLNNPGSYSAENVTVEYHGSNSYSICIIGHTECSVFGSVSLADSELIPIDFERLRFVLKSNIVGILPEENGTSPVDTSSVATKNVIGTAISDWLDGLGNRLDASSQRQMCAGTDDGFDNRGRLLTVIIMSSIVHENLGFGNLISLLPDRDSSSQFLCLGA